MCLILSAQADSLSPEQLFMYLKLGMCLSALPNLGLEDLQSSSIKSFFACDLSGDVQVCEELLQNTLTATTEGPAHTKLQRGHRCLPLTL